MIEVKNITKFYGKNIAVNDISFTVSKGEIVAFLGPNGAGKTTTMNIITGYTCSNKGNVILDGYDISKNANKVKSKIGYMPEQLPLYYDMTVEEYLKFIAELKKVKRKEVKTHIEKIMKDTSIYDMKDRLIRNLSRGYKQRVGIAQALIADPELLILDEPTIGLDPNQIIEIRNLIKSLAGKHTIILSTHILPEAEQICDRVIIIKKGKIISNCKIEDIKKEEKENNIELEVITDGEKKTVLDIIENTNGVIKADFIEQKNDELKFIIVIKNNKEVRKNIFENLIKKGYTILEIKKIEENLEDIFVKLTN